MFFLLLGACSFYHPSAIVRRIRLFWNARKRKFTKDLNWAFVFCTPVLSPSAFCSNGRLTRNEELFLFYFVEPPLVLTGAGNGTNFIHFRPRRTFFIVLRIYVLMR